VDLDPLAEQSLLLGRSVSGQTAAPLSEVRLYGSAGRFLGLGEGQPGGRVKPARLFVSVS